MALTLNSIVLPDLHWDDEFAWTSVTQLATRTESGHLVLEEAALVAGRPITLKGGSDYGFASRTTLVAIYALAQDAAATAMTLTLDDGRAFAVVWRRDGSAQPIEAAALWPYPQPTNDDQFSLTLRLMTV